MAQTPRVVCEIPTFEERDTAAAPVYVSGYDFGKPGFAQTSSTYPLHSLLQYASDPA